ncbi:AAA family ATPase [Anaeromyxobacter oryzae]|uniref:Uncharacterized protein n=1 Tax=Anaeromyxobacter oryzae TaxID=2918170 RepID=A0ABM7X4M3_9BACT|nr:hypothetical protein [Anaeromyxobacter oryzae]BDG06737.1 hypothetical protein AMOR_57330 [Anaeromyxobacter oryzae]
MILLEFAAQGVRGVAPAGGRATLRPGYNVVAADGATLRRVVEALLYPDPRDGDSLPRAAGGPAGAALRAGLTLVGNDRVTYRLVRDFAAGAQLHRFDAEKRSFALVAQDLAEISAFLRETVGAPPPARLSAVLALGAAELPSRQGASGVGGGASLAPARQALSPEQARKRLAQLQAELEKARAAEKLQVQLDGLQARAFKLDEALRGSANLRDGLETAEAARADLAPVAAAATLLGDDPEARLAAFDRATAKHDEAVAKVAAERGALAEAEARGAPRPLWTDPLFWGGVGAGAVLALGGAALSGVAPGARYLALLDVPAFGGAAWIALRWIGAVEAWERVARRRKVVDDWEKKIEGQYEKDAGDVRAAIRAIEVRSPAELREALGRIADADAVVAEWRRRLAEWEGSAEIRAAAEERVEVDEAQRALEARMAADVGGFVRDVRSVEMEIQRLEGELATALPPAAAPPPRPVAPAAGGTEPLRGLLERAAAELGGSPAAAGRAVAQKASQLLTGLTFQRITAAQVDDRGGVHAVTGGRPVPALTLPPADRDVVYVALKLALLEQALAAGKLVAVLDQEAFAGLSDGARRVAARFLKQIARPGQIVHATTDSAFREAADHSA